jgi:hypothetical protein
MIGYFSTLAVALTREPPFFSEGVNPFVRQAMGPVHPHRSPCQHCTLAPVRAFTRRIRAKQETICHDRWRAG